MDGNQGLWTTWSSLHGQFSKPQWLFSFSFLLSFYWACRRIDCSSSSYLCKAPIASTCISNSCEPTHQHITQHHRSTGSHKAGREHEQIVQIGRNRRHMDVGIAEAGNHKRSMHIDCLLHPTTSTISQAQCPGRFLGILDQGPRVFKFNWLHVVSFQVFLW